MVLFLSITGQMLSFMYFPQAYTATKTELRAMNSVIKTIKVYNIEAESLLESVAESRYMLKEQSQKERKAAKAVPKPQQLLGKKQPAGPQNMKKLERHPQPAANISPPPQRTGQQIDHVSPESYSTGSYGFVEPSSGLAASYNILGSSLPAGSSVFGERSNQPSPQLRTFWLPNPYYPSHHP